MAITPLPDPPSRAEPNDFSTKADAFLGALPTFADECNTVALAMDLNDTSSTSTTSLTVGSGAKSLTVDVSKSFLPGMFIQIAQTSDPENFMNCLVTSYNSGTGALVVDSRYFEGSGTITDWTISFSAPVVENSAYESTMTGNESIDYVSGLKRVYVYDPDGTDRLLTPGSGFPTGYEAWIVNIGTDGAYVYFDGTPVSRGKQLFIYNGSSWM